MTLTQKFLKKILHYDISTGEFIWNKRNIEMFSHCKSPSRACKTWNTRFSHTIAGSIVSPKAANCKYVALTIFINGVKKRRYLAHKLAFLYINGVYNCGDIDHIDHNGLNNSWKNLRIVTHLQNKKNLGVNSANTSGFNGVTWNKNRNKWQVQLMTKVNGKTKGIYGGLFIDINDAIKKRKQMNIKYGFHKNHGKSC